MPNIAVTSKETQQLLLSADTNTVTLSENSVVKIHTAIEDVASITREGNAAIVNLKNGEKVVIESYFDDPLDSHHIVFDNGEQLYWAEFANASGEILPTIKYHFIETISPLLYADTHAALMPWVIGAVAAGATIAAVGSDSDSASSNTPVDSTAAEQLVIAAEEAQQAAEDLLSQAQEDGLITSEEQAQLQDAADAAAEAKETAQDAVTALPESADKEELQDRLDNLEGIGVPPVTDADGNGKDDAVEAAEALVTDAENAHQAAEDVIAGAQEDGLISPAEQQAIQDAVDAATEAEQTAQDAVTALAESTDKDGLQDRLDALTDLEVPAVNDQDGNGIDDATDSLIADAEAAVAAAEAAYAEAEQAIADADTDGNGLITPAEQAVAQAAIDEAAELKAIAQNAVNALPAEVQVEKDGLQERVDALTGLLAPVVTDADGDGVIDDLNGLIASAEAAVAAAEAAYAEAEQAIADADTDGNGLITPAEQAVAQAAIDEAAELKAIAQNAVNALPAEVQVEKDGLQGRLDDLIPLTAPAVTDADGNGIDDAFEAAEALVTDAENAHQAAEDVIAGAQEDGLISPAEQQAIQDAVDAATEAEQTAQDAVTALAESTDKDGLQDRLDALTDLEVPAVNDQDGNGIDDATDSLIADAEAAVAAAEAAYAEAEQAIADADTDGNGLITPAEQAVAQAAIDEAAELKAIAQNAVNALPAEVQVEKDGLQGRLNDLVDITLPAVNDENEDGVDDAVAALEEATEAVEAAEAAYAEAEQALADAESDGLITPTELAELTQARDDALTAKEDAQAKVDALPEGADKDALDARLDDLVDITLPAVNDENEDGVDDAVAALEEATEAVEAAEAAYAEAEQALADAESDGLITPTELAELTQARDDALTAKEDAQAKVDALPEGADKDALDARLDDLVDITLPTVNDENEDGVADEYEQVLADAEAAVEAAEAAYAAAEQALIDANANGLITPTELTALTQARDDALAAKTEAQTKVTALPEAVQAEKDALQGRLNDLVDITLPTVNDQNENDISDDIDTLLAGVEALIESAEEAYTTAEEDLADALQDGTVTQAEADRLQESLEAAQAAKTLAQQALDNIDQTSDAIEAAKALLQERIDDLVDIEVPEPFATANNDVQLVLDITPTVDVNETPTELNSTGFTVGSVGLGPVLNVSVLESVFSSSVSLSVEEGTERDISFYADAGGVTVGTMNLFMYKLNESTGEYELKEKIDNWYLVVLGGVSETISRSLDEGEWLIVLGNGQGLSAVTGYTLRFESDAVRDFNNPEAVTGTINGNVITDQDYQNGTDVVPEGSKISGVTHGENTINQFTDGIATIKGEYGTLTISENGQYTYTVDPLFRDYGEVDRFVYEVTAPNGEKRTAELNIELVRVATDENAIIDNTVLLDVTPDLTETTGEALGISNAVALNLLDLGIAGDVLSASVIGKEGVMDFTVEDGTFQEMTFTGSAGGVTLLSTFSLVIYRLDENTEQLVQVHEIPNFVQVIIGGGVSTPVTLSFGEGTYVGIIKQTSGVNVIGGASAQVTDVNIYDYANPEMITGSVQGDATPITTDKLILVNNTDVVEGEALVVQGQYGSLNINTDGTYTYNVTVPQSTVGWTPPYGEIDRFEVVVERADGTTYIEVLNIKIDTNTVANDAEVVDVQAANYSTLNESVESGIIGSASRTLEFKVEEGSYISSLDLQGNITRTLTNDNPSMSVVINKVTTQLVNGVEQQVLEQVYTGNVSITWPAGTILNPSTSTTYASEIILDDGKVLDAGDYVISINTTSSTFNSVNVSSASITGIMVNNITPTDTPLLEGDLFENDTAIDQIDILKIGSKELYVNDPAKGGQEFTVQGKHGVLTVFKDGTYEYQPSGLSGGLETFTYTTVSKAGTSQSATLEINVSMTLTGSDEADTVQASASIDTFTLGEGADTVLYDVLNQAQHTESPDIWTDFNQAEGDRVDISALLKDQNVTSSNIGEFVTIKQDGANTVISVDTDGAKTKYNPTELIVLQNTDSSLYAIDDLLKYNQI